MNNENFLNDNLIVIYEKGGMIETWETGVYPKRLIIRSSKYEHVWRLKVRKDIQIGTLKIRKVPIYNYRFDDSEFFIQIIKKGGDLSDWILVEDMIIQMVD
jgi:hypothetical protein